MCMYMYVCVYVCIFMYIYGMYIYITIKIDYCNSLLYGMPDNQIQRLQKFRILLRVF